MNFDLYLYLFYQCFHFVNLYYHIASFSHHLTFTVLLLPYSLWLLIVAKESLLTLHEEFWHNFPVITLKQLQQRPMQQRHPLVSTWLLLVLRQNLSLTVVT
jgi:hypothetical protein